jgi:hypothetical protein
MRPANQRSYAKHNPWLTSVIGLFVRTTPKLWRNFSDFLTRQRTRTSPVNLQDMHDLTLCRQTCMSAGRTQYRDANFSYLTW